MRSAPQAPPARATHVEGRLRIELDGAEVVVVGEGRSAPLRAYVSDPRVVRQALPRGPRSLGPPADALARAGLQVELVHGGRVVGRLGAGVRSLVGSVVGGSRHARLGLPFLLRLLLRR